MVSGGEGDLHTAGDMGGGGWGRSQLKLLEEAQGMVPAHCPSWLLRGGSMLLFLSRWETFAK